MSNNETKKEPAKPAEHSFSEKFNVFFNKNVRPKLKHIEETRKQYQMISCAIPVVLIVLGIIYNIFISMKNHNISISFTVFIAAGVIAFLCTQVLQKIYSSKAKSEVLPIILSFLGNFKINDSSEKLNTYVDDLHLFNPFNLYVYDDRLKGKYKDLDIDIEEISLENENRRQSEYSRIKQSGSGVTSAKLRLFYKLFTTVLNCIENQSASISTSKKVFSGIFIRVPALKKYKGRTVVKAEKTPHRIKEETKVNLEDPEFEKLYDTYSTDQVEARYLLTTAFMNRMVTLSQKGIGNRILVSFEKGYVNIAVSMDDDWLEIPLSKPVTDIANYKNMISELYSVLKIIDTLKLDQNIGL